MSAIDRPEVRVEEGRFGGGTDAPVLYQNTSNLDTHEARLANLRTTLSLLMAQFGGRDEEIGEQREFTQELNRLSAVLFADRLLVKEETVNLLQAQVDRLRTWWMEISSVN